MTPPLPSPPDLVVLHTLRCVGATSSARLGTALVDLAVGDLETHLLRLEAQGLADLEPGEFGGWRITELGRTIDTERISQELEAVGARAEVRAAYEGFLPLNRQLLDLCGAWQLRTYGETTLLNDHTDRSYDARILEEFGVVDARVRPVCARLGTVLERFTPYGARLGRSLARARRGETVWLCDHLESYHAVWFQLHEDLLLTLGIDRSSTAG